MRRLLVLVCVLATFAAVSYFALRRGDTGPSAALTGAEEQAATAPPTSAKATLATSTDDASLATPVAAAAVRETAPEALEAAQRLAERTVRGAIVAPAGCADGAARVVALDRSRSIDEYFAMQAARARALKSPTLDDEGTKSVAVAPDGRFELVLPEGWTSAHLLVLGDHWFSTRTVEAQPGAPVGLAVECGAKLEVVLTLPDELRSRAAQLEGLLVDLRVDAGVGEGIFGGRRSTLVASGRAVFGAVDPRATFEVEGQPAFVAAFHAPVTELRAGATREQTITLQRGGLVRGLVRSKDGAPQGGARVQAKRPGRFFGFDDRAVRTSTSAPDGTFELTAVEPGSVSLVADLTGFLASDAQKLEVQDGGTLSGLEIVLDAGASIAGTLVWPDGTPAHGIDVTASLDVSQRVGMNAFNARRGTDAQTVAEEDGSFVLRGLEGGPFVLSATALTPAAQAELDALPEDVRSKRRADYEVRARVEGVAAGTTGVKLELRPPLVLSGKVVDTAGAPVARFHVRAEVVADGPFGSLGREPVTRDFDDETGALRLALPSPGKWKLTVRAKGFADLDGFETSVPRAESDGELLVTLERQCVVSGFVRSTSGAPIVDAEVWQADGQPGFMRQIQIARGAVVARSDAEGRFRLDRLKSGRVVVVADHREHAKSLEMPLELAEGEERADVSIVLREGGTLTGEVYGDGKPLAGHLVQATDLKSFAQNTGSTDAQGRFRFEHVEPGGYQVVAMPAVGDEGKADAAAMFQKMKMTMCDVREGELTHVVLGAAPLSPVKLHGRVTHAGEPYAGATLSFVAAGKNALGALKFIQLGSDGAYSVTLDKPGEYVATVQKFSGGMMQQTSTEFACTIPEAAEHELDFELPTGRVSGRVTLEDRSPAAGVRVSVLPGGAIETGTMWGGQYHELVTDADGNFDAQALRPGRYTIAVGGATLVNLFGGAAKHGRELRDVELSTGEWERDVDFRLRTPGTAEITVVDEGGAPVEGAAVFARDERGKLLDRLSMLASDASGVVKYGGIAPGKYYFSARKEGLASAESALVEIRSDAVTAAKVQVAAATRLLVRIEQDDKPVRASLSVLDASGREHAGVFGMADVQAMFAQDGFQPNEVRVGPLAPGKYVLRATAGDKSAERKLTLTGTPEKKITLELK